MRIIIEGPPAPGAVRKPLRVRLMWFAVLWTGGLLATTGAAALLRALIL